MGAVGQPSMLGAGAPGSTALALVPPSPSLGSRWKGRPGSATVQFAALLRAGRAPRGLGLRCASERSRAQWRRPGAEQLAEAA